MAFFKGRKKKDHF